MLCENENVVKMLMDHGASPSACDVEGERPIHVAASEDQCEFIELLAKKGVLKIQSVLYVFYQVLKLNHKAKSALLII